MIGLYSRSLTLNISIEDDHPTVLLQDIVWTFNGKEIMEDGVLYTFFNDKKSLKINNLNVSHEGLYTVTASNPAGSDSASIQVDVQGITIKMYHLGGLFYVEIFTG